MTSCIRSCPYGSPDPASALGPRPNGGLKNALRFPLGESGGMSDERDEDWMLADRAASRCLSVRGLGGMGRRSGGTLWRETAKSRMPGSRVCERLRRDREFVVRRKVLRKS